jgi:hypothetical protein
MTYLAGQLGLYILPSTYITALALALTHQGTCQSLIYQPENSAIVKVSQRKGYGWSGEEATSGNPSGGASVLSIAMSSWSKSLSELPEWEAILIDEGVAGTVIVATPSVGGGMSSFESYR